MTAAPGAAPAPSGGVVSGVAPGSPADEAGLRAGDVLVSVDGRSVRDVLDWQWATAGGGFDAEVVGPDGRTRTVRVRDAVSAPVGVEFAERLFDGVMTCENACVFCFVSQLPPGLRDSLYVRDDDFRLSFMDGSFVTLTNLDDGDIDRIVEQRLSPLHVSVHSVDPGIRRGMMCQSVPDAALEHIDALAEGGIELRVQVVLVPGVNDGEALERTLEWLSERPGVTSVGIVPVGWTRHQSRITGSFESPEAAAAVIRALSPWRERMVSARGVRWVHAADELYLAAGEQVPPAADYDGYPQYENGVGLVRDFVDEWRVADGAGRGAGGAEVPVAVTGEMFGPVLKGMWPGEVLAVQNRFFGGNVAVTGLLTGEDIAGAVVAHGGHATYLVPDVVMNVDGLTLDGMTAGGMVGAAGGADVRLISCGAAVLNAAGRGADMPPAVATEGV